MMTGRFFLSFFSAFLWISPTVQADSRVKVGSPAPPLTLKDVCCRHLSKRTGPGKS